MPLGVLFALGAYALYSCCDAIIKGFGSTLPVFEIAFFSSLFSLLPAIFTKSKGEHWRGMLRAKHPWLLHARSATGLIGNLCIIYAFVHIPLADAYSIAFLAPIFIVILSVFLLRETVSWPRAVFLTLTFLGVLLVVRPGFRDLQLGHLLALVAALMGGISTTILRYVAPVEKRVSLIGVPLGYIIIFNGVAMIPTFVMPTWQDFALFLVIGGLGGTGNLLFIHATRIAKASEIAPGQYSQIAWAIVLGAIFYHEFPDAIGYCGLAVVAAFGILNVISDETRIRIFSRLSPSGIGPATAAAEISLPPEDEADGPKEREKTDA
jgi:drug/metabolite transporter (DMT)-like permease